MTDFEYDCLQKKRTANQARYRKRGSKSKKCNLPSDRLTNKQWKDKCGPVITYSLNKPMIWDDFKKMPAYVQAEYITSLQKKFGVTAVDLGNMFGVRALTVRKHADANKLGVEFPRGHAMNAARRAEWAQFIGEENHEEVNIPSPANLPESSNPVVFNTDEYEDKCFLQPEEQEEDGNAVMPLEPKAMCMKKFTLQFAGAIDVNAVANSLKLILGDKSEGELEIICNLA